MTKINENKIGYSLNKLSLSTFQIFTSKNISKNVYV